MQILLLLAHADDESLGAGGAIQKWLSEGHQIQLIIVSDGVVGMREGGANNRDALFAACKKLGIKEVDTLDFPDQQFEMHPIAAIANKAGQAISQTPDLIVTHSDKDLNQDHRITAEVAKIIGRPRGKQTSIIACEIPSVATWNGQRFAPQLYVPLTAAQLQTKIEAFACYQNEVREFPDPYSAKGLEVMAQFRGQESGHTAAEAFEVIRWYA